MCHFCRNTTVPILGNADVAVALPTARNISAVGHCSSLDRRLLAEKRRDRDLLANRDLDDRPCRRGRVWHHRAVAYTHRKCDNSGPLQPAETNGSFTYSSEPFQRTRTDTSVIPRSCTARCTMNRPQLGRSQPETGSFGTGCQNTTWTSTAAPESGRSPRRRNTPRQEHSLAHHSEARSFCR